MFGFSFFSILPEAFLLQEYSIKDDAILDEATQLGLSTAKLF